MASIVPTEGLDYMLGIFPKNGTNASSLYLGLLSDSAGSGITVPTATATLAAFGGTFSEASYTSYARVEVTAAEWTTGPADVTIGSAATRALTASQQSFAAAGAADLAQPIVGFFLCTVSAGTAGDVVYFANFTNGASDVISSLALGDIVRVTPTFGLGDVAGVA